MRLRFGAACSTHLHLALMVCSLVALPLFSTEQESAQPAEGGSGAEDGTRHYAPALKPLDASTDKSEDDYSSLAEKFFRFPVTGSLTTKYIIRSGEYHGTTYDGIGVEPTDHRRNVLRRTDQDIYNYLNASIGTKKQFASGYFDLRYSYDLNGYNGYTDYLRRNGLSDVDRRDLFINVDDALNRPDNFRLYSAWIDFNKIPGIKLLRLGRQYTYETPEVFEFDGGRIDTQTFLGEAELFFSVFGGTPVHRFENRRKGFDSDYVFGAAVEGRPWKGGKLRMDYAHSTDTYREPGFYPNNNPAAISPWYWEHYTLNDDVLAWNFWQTFEDPNLYLQAKFTMLNNEAREGFLRVHYEKPDWGLYVTGTYRTYFNIQNRLTREFDFFDDVVGGLEPYQQGDLVIGEEWNKHLFTEIGASIHRFAWGGEGLNGEFLSNAEGIFRIGDYDKEWERYWGTIEIRDLPVKDLTFTFTGAMYNGQNRAASTVELTGDVNYRWNKQLETTVGTNYYYYQFDYVYNPVYRDNTRTWFIDQTWRPTKWAKLDVGYEFEKYKTSFFHTFKASFRFSF